MLATQSLPHKIILYLRAGIFEVVFVISAIIFSTLGLLTYPLPFRRRYQFLTAWADLNIWCLKIVCKLNYRVEGLENVPTQPSIVMSNHQSAWETLALKKFFPPMAWVVKRELTWIPFFGWGLALVEPIAIDRGSGQKAVEQLLEKGQRRLESGRWIIVFPEGTRVAPGNKRRYRLGGAIVASQAQVPIVPVAHNSGLFWSRRQFLKFPGTITVSIGRPIDSRGKSPARLNAEVQAWIEAKQNQINRRTNHQQNRVNTPV
jgi:1-acyl-sn-glycerol-3-phosphate acyltransferase